MATATPNSRPAHQWRAWVRDGSVMYRRLLGTWGLLSALLYGLFGAATALLLHQPWPVCTVAALLLQVLLGASSGVMQVLHRAAAEQARTDTVSWGALSEAVRTTLRDHRPALLEITRVRLRWALLLGAPFVLTTALACLAVGAVHSGAVTPIGTGWQALWNLTDPAHVFTVSPFFLQDGIITGLTLPLMWDGWSPTEASLLSDQARSRNNLAFVGLWGVFLVVSQTAAWLCPPLNLFVPGWWCCVMARVHDDLFDRGGLVQRHRVTVTAAPPLAA